ncbi:efflux RND transporter periplasmic adaptor subunit [Chitinivorax sp. B]|uniref:efflux RND transporter periplasmic adaptor subunit n=1 Tax=Chitinivorax sp. B TaxID=2502235 RepID=UPI0010F499B9|nr:efflux RND transporter periplasmic adaptor subunit [Chitinivorax sp. B]
MRASWLFASTFTLAACSEPPPVPKPVPKVLVETIRQQATVAEYQYSGEIRGRHETPLAFQVGGQVLSRHVDVGSHVQTNQLLMRINPRDLDFATQQQQAAVKAAEADVRLAEKAMAQSRDLFQQQFISQAELDRSQNTFDLARARASQTQAAAAVSQNQRNYASLTAQHAGVIAELTIEPGQIVQAGQPVAVLVRDGEREVEISVPEQRLNEFRSIQRHDVEIWALPGLQLQATLRELAPNADKTSRTYKARLTLVDAPDTIQLGMTAKVRSQQAVTPHINIPTSALYQGGSVMGVWCVDAGKVHFKPVVLGAVNNQRVTVLVGLRPGERIVTTGVQKLAEGMDVRIEEARS